MRTTAQLTELATRAANNHERTGIIVVTDPELPAVRRLAARGILRINWQVRSLLGVDWRRNISIILP